MNLDVGVARTRPKSDGIASATWAEVNCPRSGNVGDGVRDFGLRPSNCRLSPRIERSAVSNSLFPQNVRR